MSLLQTRYNLENVIRDFLTRQRCQAACLAGLLLLAAWLVLGPVLSADFVHLDDKVLVTENLKIRTISSANIWGYFSSYHEFLYHPLVSLSFAIEYYFARLNPGIYHATNLVLHMINAVLVFALFSTMARQGIIAFGTALLFAIHPLHVESVAWVSGRKDTLYAAFFLGALLVYAQYISDRSRKKYIGALLLYGGALLSKSMAISLPFVIPALFWISGIKMRRENLRELIPFLVLSVVFVIITLCGYYQVKTIGKDATPGIWGNLHNACQNYLFYLIKFFYPSQLSAMYPRPMELGNIPAILFQWSPLILGALGVGAYALAKRSLVFLGGLVLFIVTLAPVSQIIPVGVGGPADRYTYVPYIGISFLLMLVFSKLRNLSVHRFGKILISGVFIASAISLGIAAYQRTRIWKNTLTLAEDMLRHYELPPQYYGNGGAAFLVDMELLLALKYFSKAIEIEPQNKAGWFNRGLVHLKSGNFERAKSDFDFAISLDAGFVPAYLRRAYAYQGLRQDRLANADLARAKALSP